MNISVKTIQDLGDQLSGILLEDSREYDEPEYGKPEAESNYDIGFSQGARWGAGRVLAKLRSMISAAEFNKTITETDLLQHNARCSANRVKIPASRYGHDMNNKLVLRESKLREIAESLSVARWDGDGDGSRSRVMAEARDPDKTDPANLRGGLEGFLDRLDAYFLGQARGIQLLTRRLCEEIDSVSHIPSEPANKSGHRLFNQTDV